MNKYFIRAKYLTSHNNGVQFAEFIVSAETTEEARIACQKTYGWNCVVFEVLFCLNLSTCKDECILSDMMKYCYKNREIVSDDEEEDQYI